MDRFFRGLVSGVLAGIVMNVWSLFSYHILHLSRLRFLDWTGVILYGHLPKDWLEAGYALIIHLCWVGFLGIIFANLIPEVTSQGYLFKGAFYALIVGLILYSIPTLFKINEIYNRNLSTVISNHIGGLIWGLVLAMCLKRLDLKQNTKSNN